MFAVKKPNVSESGGPILTCKMTIQADFLKLLKTDCPAAFVDTLPPQHIPSIVFIDGQVKLMKAESVKTWPLFVKVQFMSTIERAFASGAHTVVLGFDDYRYVPSAKNMTQIKRNKVVPVMEFGAHDTLPYCLPDQWSSAMRNRNFKVKVVNKVIEDVKVWFLKYVQEYPLWSQRCLVIDFCGKPVVLRSANSLPSKDLALFVENQAETFWVGRGECDVKAFTWLVKNQPLLIVSTDGDFVPMSLLQLQDKPDCEIYIQRLKIHVETSPLGKATGTEANQGKRSNKRKASELSTTAVVFNSNESKRSYEFVLMSKVMSWVQQNMPSKTCAPIMQFSAMIAMCGCDFVMTLPRVGARTIWKYRQKLQSLNLSTTSDILSAMSIIYYDMYVAKHVTPVFLQHSAQNSRMQDISFCREGYTTMFKRLQNNAKVAANIKTAVWSVDRACAHAKNTQWALQYWTKLQHADDAHATDYGYSKDAKGRTIFACL